MSGGCGWALALGMLQIKKAPWALLAMGMGVGGVAAAVVVILLLLCCCCCAAAFCVALLLSLFVKL